MKLAGYALSIITGFGSGVIISGAVFAFIAIIGIVPRMAQKTKTQNCIVLYEEAIILGGIFGAGAGLFDYRIRLPIVVVMALSLCAGVFYGILAVSLAEVLDAIPILTRRGRLQQGMFWFIIAIALGKLTGSLLYGLVPGFHK